MNRLFTLFILVTLFSIVTYAQKEGLASINQNDLKSYMTFFASDELAGRETGTPQNNAAALYIKTNLMRLGLKPVPGSEDYFQKIPLIKSATDKKNTFVKVSGINGETSYQTDSIIPLIRPAASVSHTGKLVFAGYGYTDKDKDYNDLAGIDLKDKIVLIMTGKPGDMPSDNYEFFDQNTEGLKIMSFVGAGAKAVLLAYDPAGRYRDAFESGLAGLISGDAVSLSGQGEFSLPIQISFITQNTANALLKTTGNNLMQMRDKIISAGNPVSTDVPGMIVTVSTGITKTEFTASNVIGFVEGSNPSLKGECIVYTSHFDHTGTDASGNINNGADDDASGSMALLEIAEGFVKLQRKPLRSVVIAWVNGEEKGLLGSRYYAENPLIPLGKTLANINLDMVGRSKTEADTGKLFGFELNVTQPRELIVYTAHESSELLNKMYLSAREVGLVIKDMGRDIPQGSSDHAPFRDKGIPALCFHSGVHADLHGPGDDVEKIDFDKVERSAKMAFLLGYRVANQKKRLVVDNPGK